MGKRLARSTAIAASSPLPAPNPIVTIESVSGFIELIEGFYTEDKSRTLWFRGVSDSSFSLVPSLYRKIPVGLSYPDRDSRLKEMEKQIVRMFIDSGYPFIEKSIISDKWNLLFLMQHHGSPTRLLDWTISPLISLYFSVSANLDSDGAVWILDPKRFNHTNNSGDVNSNTIYSVDDPQLEAYKVENIRKVPPVCIHAAYNNQRIVSQRGVFLLFGTDPFYLDEFFPSSLNITSKILQKVVISSAAKKKVSSLLTKFGYSHGHLFPGLEGISTDINAHFGHE